MGAQAPGAIPVVAANRGCPVRVKEGQSKQFEKYSQMVVSCHKPLNRSSGPKIRSFGSA